MELTLESCKAESANFTNKTFIERIKFIQENKDVLTLASDGNWWGVKVKDAEIQQELEDLEMNFHIKNEWGSSEMYDLIELLGIGNTDI